MSGANAFKFGHAHCYKTTPTAIRLPGWRREVLESSRRPVWKTRTRRRGEIVDAVMRLRAAARELLGCRTKRSRLQSPQIAPPAGYYYPALIEHPLQVTNFREIFNDHIGAHILAFVLAFARGLHVFIPQQARHEGKKSSQEVVDVVHLPEATAPIVGVGGIGTEVGAAAGGVRREGAGYFTPSDGVQLAGVAELHGPEALDALLPRADFVILTVPHTPATEGFFNRARFQRMKKSAFFINIGRGMTPKLDELVDALNAKESAGAALDVFEIEPLPSEHPLWTMPNVLLTPHMAGHGPYLNDRRYEIVKENCRRFAAGTALMNGVDKGSWF